MSLDEWVSLQKKFNVRIFDAEYQSMTIEEGKSFLKSINNNFSKIYEDDNQEGDDI